ncbi:transcriptional regulator family: Fungal Specific TF [Penicillium roqueforti]|uniref:Zn(2)-C6 fungal-type DNA-binding domain n=1 Tax=Penicillium roqueforti (strain FM164) TaxID=1365484 RepID=W6QRK4_PENRF|nr:transcriptional regulator family: Fungal Specific TF [Penicillium roqueforti]CDM36689.1 Zn(2)-C6 fungal-type DNA-binding domain [Penicillium roqueforti FM164]KAF9250192.1 transcriptional regulator family: Fungal Specific TF [Penicillium roqueforti]KAI2717148.1 transcriptional regulator family: Fungal Specific TF [Penicillium roqueforti]KAI2768091.1 transcriptional regulator family: Fungal Specific TF [Penicillium roqueforti]KAI3082708.1 transcriptional regulator family: Fungal Specific TF [
MRLSISCDACRQAKVKCLHEGQPPCQRCLKNKNQECDLTDPRASKQRTRGNIVSSRTPRKRKALSALSPMIEDAERSTPRNVTVAQDLSKDPIAALSPATIISAVETYRKKFPITNFLHYPSLISDISSNVHSVDSVFVASVLSLCVRFMNSDELEEEETYADYARKNLAQRVLEAPSLYLAQSLVMISFYEWGTGRPYQAWMYSGMATYMIQSLLKMADDSMEHNPQEFHASQTQYEQLVRTYWCCFAQDCELSSGARQHFALSFSQISVPLPISDRDFTFNHTPANRLMPADMNKDCLLAKNLTIEHGLTIVTRGFDIFVRILRFANEHRRALASLSSDDSATSPLLLTWQVLKKELDEWRFLQDVTVQFPATSVQSHVALGYGELFAYINLVHCMSILFLHRDRFLSNLKPHSDVFHDANDDTQGEPDTIKQLFEAAQQIGGILNALDASGAPIMSPYSGFSVFVAAHINMYGTIAPQRYPGGLKRAEEEKSRNLDYLERLSKLWPVGRSWWRTVQEANRFYEIVKSNQSHSESGMHSPRRFALAGTLDEYGDIRSRPSRDAYATRARTSESRDTHSSHTCGGTSSSPALGETNFLPRENAAIGSHHDFETDMFQWPFIDGSWSLGFDAGLDGLWYNSGLFDPNPSLR